jgi:hypothetical protein
MLLLVSMTERKKTKRKVDLVSSHSDNERDEGPLAVCIDTGSAVSELYKDDRIPSFMRYKPGAGQTVVYEEYYIPDVD